MEVALVEIRCVALCEETQRFTPHVLQKFYMILIAYLQISCCPDMKLRDHQIVTATCLWPDILKHVHFVSLHSHEAQ